MPKEKKTGTATLTLWAEVRFTGTVNHEHDSHLLALCGGVVLFFHPRYHVGHEKQLGVEAGTYLGSD